jgi:MFS family permease
MLGLPNSWRSAYYLYSASGVFVWIIGSIFLSESHFDREEAHKRYGEASEFSEGVDDKGQPRVIERVSPVDLPKPLTFVQRLKPWGPPNKELNMLTPVWRQFIFLAYPAVIWTIIFYGLAIGIGALYIGLSFSILITGPPWHWTQTATGLNTVGGLIGVLIAIPVGPISDRFAAWRTRKNNGIREPEMRLWTFLPAIILSPVGLAVFSCTAYYKLHWFGFLAGNCIFQCANFIGFSILIAYMVDCYNRNTPELIAIFIAAKSALTFGMGFKVLVWIEQQGFLIIGMTFTAVMWFVCMWGIFFIIFGKKIRRWTGQWKVSHVHKL